MINTNATVRDGRGADLRFRGSAGIKRSDFQTNLSFLYSNGLKCSRRSCLQAVWGGSLRQLGTRGIIRNHIPQHRHQLARIAAGRGDLPELKAMLAKARVKARDMPVQPVVPSLPDSTSEPREAVAA